MYYSNFLCQKYKVLLTYLLTFLLTYLTYKAMADRDKKRRR